MIMAEYNRLIAEIKAKKGRIGVLEEKVESYKDDITLNNNQIPPFYKDNRAVNTREEDHQYELCKNEMIELRMGAKEGLALLRQAMTDKLGQENEKGKIEMEE